MIKLIGSKAEHRFREELKNSNALLNTKTEHLNRALKNAGHQLSKSYVLNHIPEQYEDIYVLLISGLYILNVEIDRFDSEVSPIIERIELNDYLHCLSKVCQIQIAVAMDLVQNKKL